ncbi:MAG: NAD(P)-dependent oxidoreductase [Sphingobacteriales bacterium]|nr:MAG: NAD(P)-dependent oxidoreductase [Sphingobacteriales bacterium]
MEFKRILVTGGSGFLGSHIADELTNTGHQVAVLDVRPSPYLRPDQEMIIGDITDFDFLNALLGRFDVVYHLAALADLNEAQSMPIATVQINVLGTVNLLEASRLNNIERFVFGSTVYVYSREGGFYRCSKQACENYIEEFQERFGLNYTILRFGSLYGPRADETNGVYRLLRKYMEEAKMQYSGRSSDKRDYIHVYDASRLSAEILEDAFVNKNLILTGNDKLTISELFKTFEEILNRKVDVHYLGDEGKGNGHYNITPYAYTPKIGKKLVSQEYVDMGQGIIQVIEQIEQERVIEL